MFKISKIDGVAFLTFDHGKVNAIDIEFCRGTMELLDQCLQWNVDALIVKGNPRAFSAGIDLKRWLNEGEDYVEPFLSDLEKLFTRLFTFPKPVVAVIDGPAVAGGCMLAAAADYRLITPDAKIGIPELRIGVPLPMSAIEIMRFVAQPAAFHGIVNGGAMFDGRAAVENGLANRVASPETIVDEAIEVANELAAVPGAAFALTKKQTHAPALKNIEENKGQLQDEFLDIWKSPATREAIQHYVDNRLVKS